MTEQQDVREGLLATILSEEAYRPNEPETMQEAGLTNSLVESLICKRLTMVGISSGRQIAEHICLPFRMLEPLFHEMRTRQIIMHKSSAPLNDYNYSLTEQGTDRARIAMDTCAYVGAAPVPLMEYILSAEAQSIRAESPKREDLHDAFDDITIDEELFESLGPAINSGAGLFLYGEPGNGKSTLAKRITQCFGQDVWIPKVLIEDGQLIKLFDAAVHEPSSEDESSILKTAAYDRRWIKIKRPTVIVGGELTMDGLEIRYDPNSNVSEAPLQMKSNCGCLLIDDFGRQRIDPVELLNRWIVPLESRYDFLTLSTGKKIQVPFEQLIIFSTNLDPASLTDEAFLRRIPYKIEIGDPSLDEFHQLFELYGDVFDCEYRPDVIDILIEKHYEQAGRAMRRCHPRDLLQQIRNFCSYNELEMEMRDEYFDRVVKSYFSVVVDQSETRAQASGKSDNPPAFQKAKPAPASKRDRTASEKNTPAETELKPEQTFSFDSQPEPDPTNTMSGTLPPTPTVEPPGQATTKEAAPPATQTVMRTTAPAVAQPATTTHSQLDPTPQPKLQPLQAMPSTTPTPPPQEALLTDGDSPVVASAPLCPPTATPPHHPTPANP